MWSPLRIVVLSMAALALLGATSTEALPRDIFRDVDDYLGRAGTRPPEFMPPVRRVTLPSNNLFDDNPDTTNMPRYEVLYLDFLTIGAGAAIYTAAGLADHYPNKQHGLFSSGSPASDLQWLPEAQYDNGVKLWDFAQSDADHPVYADEQWTYETDPVTGATNARGSKFPDVKITGGASACNTAVVVKVDCSWLERFCLLGGFCTWNCSTEFKNIANAPFKYKTPVASTAAAANHGHTGPIVVQTPPPEPIMQAFIDAMSTVTGNPVLPDFDSFSTLGASSFGRTVDTDPVTQAPIRQDIYVKVIVNGPARPQLRVFHDTVCHRLFYGHQKSSRGWNIPAGAWCFDQANLILYKVYVSQKIILGNNLDMVKFLELSGYGNRTHLAEIGVESVFHNPHLGEHLRTVFSIPAIPYFVAVGAPLTKSPGNVVGGYFVSDFSRVNGTGRIDGQLGGAVYTPNVVITIPFEHNYPSEGSSHAKSNNINDDAVTRTNIGHDPHDFDAMLQTVKLTREFIGIINGQGVYYLVDVSGIATLVTDADLLAYIKANFVADWHWNGYAAMGLVVDEYQNLIGLEKVGVIGGGVVPPFAPFETHSSAEFALISASKQLADTIAGH